MRVTPGMIGLLIAVVLTSGTVYAKQKDHHFGPTGILGAISKQQIQVTKVAKGSPADGKVKVGDVILGAGGSLFKSDVRREFADAIDRAETREGKGILRLTLKGDGSPTRKVHLQLKVLGAYSETAPYNCPKSDAIITQTAEHILRTGKYGRLKVGLLGLLATGEKKYIDAAGQIIRGNSRLLSPDIGAGLETGTGYVGWYWGYSCLLLCEYYLQTGDKAVLPAIKAYAIGIAMGQDVAGLWGHRMAYRSLNKMLYSYDGLHGRLPGYAHINQSSLPLFASLILAEKCGIKHPEITAAIRKSHAFYANFVGKGGLPYGNHAAMEHLINDNGKGACLAVAFALEGHLRGARFFSRMAAAAHRGMETGHTGYFFNQLWTGLGANVAGPDISAAFFKETRWLHTLNRTWDGGFTYDGGSYRGCSDAGSHLLNYCRGRRKLFITGRDADKILYVIDDKDRTYTSYHADGPRQIGLAILDNLNIQEAIELTVRTIEPKRGRPNQRFNKGPGGGRKGQLSKFGANAKPFLDELKAMKLGKDWDATIKAIEESQTTREMISLEEAKKAGLGSRK